MFPIAFRFRSTPPVQSLFVDAMVWLYELAVEHSLPFYVLISINMSYWPTDSCWVTLAIPYINLPSHYRCSSHHYEPKPGAEPGVCLADYTPEWIEGPRPTLASRLSWWECKHKLRLNRRKLKRRLDWHTTALLSKSLQHHGYWAVLHTTRLNASKAIDLTQEPQW